MTIQNCNPLIQPYITYINSNNWVTHFVSLGMHHTICIPNALSYKNIHFEPNIFIRAHTRIIAIPLTRYEMQTGLQWKHRVIYTVFFELGMANNMLHWSYSLKTNSWKVSLDVLCSCMLTRRARGENTMVGTSLFKHDLCEICKTESACPCGVIEVWSMMELILIFKYFAWGGRVFNFRIR